MTVRRAVRVAGIVQGVGFRPFVHALATSLGLAGMVGNDSHGVFVEVEGPPEQIEEFLRALEEKPPPLAVIERITTREADPTGEDGFVIVTSEAAGERVAPISPDTATCNDCLREIGDRRDRRYRYPFTNCTNCGPRFTIVRDVPYDRAATTMASFAMCLDCAREYNDPSDRRFHAQPVCCPACGPRLSLVDHERAPIGGEPVARVAEMLGEGHVIAIKGLGGYHLAALASSSEATGALRERKHREEKPFAIMVRDLEAARTLCELDGADERALTSRRRPIVLVRRLADAPVAEAVAPGNRYLGLMLPYTPLHHLLAGDVGEPFVLTSGNVSDEPIAYEDGDAYRRLGRIADAFLVHDRPIHVRTDDSVTRVFGGTEMILRRSRGYAPQPVALPVEASLPLLACGAELKSTFCLAKGRNAFVSHHIGDLENLETLKAFTDGIEHFRRLFDIDPVVVAHDLHPEYMSTKYAEDFEDVRLVGVQHHHAHIASCMADNGVTDRVIGVAFDGLGFGADGTLWGGEFILAGLDRFLRLGHLEAVPMPGGTAAINEPWRMAAAYLDLAYGDSLPGDLELLKRRGRTWEKVLATARAGVNSPQTSSAGRLFDAIAALCGVRDVITYEGQAAIELEQLADPREASAYAMSLEPGEPFRVNVAGLVHDVAEDLRRGVPTRTVAARFHNALAGAVVEGCRLAREETGLEVVALSGGVFQNVLLLDRTVPGLREAGFSVLLHGRVPPNDGGISLGQAAVAAAQLAATPGA